MNLILRAVILLLATAPLFVAKRFHVPLWEIFLAAALGSGLGQLAIHLTRERPRTKRGLLVLVAMGLVGAITLLLRPHAPVRRTFVVANVPGEPPSLTLEDARALQELAEVTTLAPVLRRGGEQLATDDTNWSVQVLGTTPALLAIRGWTVTRGAMFSEDDGAAAAKVVVLGPTTAKQLLGSTDVVGKSVRFEKREWHVVGVLASTEEPYDNDVAIVPLASLQRYVASTSRFTGNLVVLPRVGAQPDPLRVLLRDRHRLRPGAEDDFVVRDTSAP